MNPEHIIDKILRNVPLTKEEAEWWSTRKDSTDIVKDIDFLKELEAPLSIANKKILKEELISYEAKYEKKKEEKIALKTKVFSLQRWASIAAVGLVLITSIIVFNNSQRAAPFDDYFEPYPSILNPIVKGSQVETSQNDQIMQAYQNENYNLVIELMEDGLNNDTLNFYYANALLARHEAKEAIEIFTSLQNTENRFTREAMWYEALSLLQLGNTETAILKLQSITNNTQHPYAVEADELLRKIQ